MSYSNQPKFSFVSPPQMNRIEKQEALRHFASEELFRGTKEVLIDHAGEQYRLRLTKNGKLILHK
ncbi:hypothetical protein MNBD_PLANCTO02-1633 [hydrothermal vent metagenome]|uniref:Hemin uptake protein HemP n=1 Tax=hydrothermal vent metagenome TaxID=652676 RepID=A0A3B1DZE8_9ZZZZ